jgi:hypothetical protein
MIRRFGFPDIFDDELMQLLVELVVTAIKVKSGSVDIQPTPAISTYMQLTPTGSADIQPTPTIEVYE